MTISSSGSRKKATTNVTASSVKDVIADTPVTVSSEFSKFTFD